MHDNYITAIVGILTAIIGVAIIATIVSKQSNTASVISAGASGFSSILQTALSPVTGSGNSLLGNFSTTPGGLNGTLNMPGGL